MFSWIPRTDSTLTNTTNGESEDWNSSRYSSSGSGSPRTPGSSTPRSSIGSFSSPCDFRTGATTTLPQPFIPASLVDHGRQGPALPQIFPSLPETTPPESVDPTDVQTPDNWINRNPNLVRLTGKHPFNCESRLDKLYDAGFLTPPELFFVRNHGAVPRVQGQVLENWSIRIHGLVEREESFTLTNLKDLFPVVTLPVTLVCAGNRRKEQNVVRKGLGFNWGAAGLSTALFTGVYLADVLDHVQPMRPRAKHVIFEGADSLPNGPYGTSQRLSWAANKEKGMLIAWAMNGLPLEPDHGFPVRVVIPGQIGGRSVKWLNRIEVSAEESQHHLHFWDNKVLPTQVMPEQARAEEGWWKNPKYIINDLNVNSAIAKPNHDETLPVPENEDNKGALYAIRGYAYSGGGRRVARVEISLDEGVCWKLAEITYPEDLYRAMCHEDDVYGTLDLTERETCFCWCFWKFEVPILALAQGNAIIVRAMDEGLGSQPRDMYWNATGMMNNWWFRVAIHKIQMGNQTTLRFEHPTMAGTTPGGWMLRMRDAGEDYLKPSFSTANESPSSANEPGGPANVDVVMTKPDIQRKITWSEVQVHDKAEPWFVVNGEVYDGTGFLDVHPGGAESILISAGEDVTEDFMAIHSPEGKLKLAAFHIGTLDLNSKALPPSVADAKCEVGKVFLHPTRWKSSRLVKIDRISHNSYIFRFALEHPDQSLGLPVGQHVFVRIRRKSTGELVQRAYTPVSRQHEKGFVDLLVKIYLPNSQFPAGGKMSVGFHELTTGDYVEMKGPLGLFTWEGRGVASWKGTRRKVKNVGLICGGSGITPIIQVLRAVLHDKGDNETRLWLLDTNKTENDILCREELDSLCQLYKGNRFVLHHTVGKAPQRWTFSTGRISDQMLATHLPPPSDDALILTCGPRLMIELTVKPGLERLGWNVSSNLVVF